jgi:hypothetical protein
VGDQVSHPYKTIGKVAVLYISVSEMGRREAAENGGKLLWI